MALTIQITARKLLQRAQKASNAALNAIGLPTFSISGTLETAQIADNAVTAAKAQYGAWHWASVGGSANAITLTTGNSLSGTPATGEVVAFQATAANTGAVDVTVDSYAQANLFKQNGRELVQDDLANGGIYVIRFDGADWRLINRVNNDEVVVGEDAGSSDAYAFTAGATLVAYRTGLVACFKANTKNSGAASLNISTIGAATIKKQKDQDLGSGDIKAGQWVTVVYDGTNWQMVSAPAQVDAPSVPAVSHDLQVVKGGTPASQMDIDADFLMVTNAAGGQKLLTSVNLTVDMATVEAQNGLDDGTEQASTWYYVYVCYDQATDATFALFSTSSNAPSTDHVDYTHYAQVGVVRNDSGSDFAQFAARRGDQWEFESAEITLDAAGSATHTAAHPFGRVPKAMRGVMVCKTADMGFAVDDELEAAAAHYSASGNEWSALAASANGTTLSVVQSVSDGAIYVTRLDTQAAADITTARWKLKIYATF